MSTNQFYISKINFRGFKSFKNAQVKFNPGFMALAGPNGSGKSNVADAIRFCFGEMGTKAIRVKRASELINLNSSRGEVTIVLESSQKNGKKFEIRRTISADGKTTYQLNGKRTTRTNVLESLRPHGLEIGHHNIIAQGQVQRIVEMNPKDRRGIIDQVAGISEFDDKKKEALRELSKVEQKISESKIVLAERGAYLAELEKEKDAALAHGDARRNLDSARATLLNTEYTKLNSQFDELLDSQKQIQLEVDQLNTQLTSLEDKKSQIDKKRKELSEKMGDGDKKNALLNSIQNLKVSIAQKSTSLEEKEARIQEISQSIDELEQKKKQFSHTLTTANAQLTQKENYLSKLKEELQKAKKEAGLDSDLNDDQVSTIEKLNEQLSSVRQQRASIQATMSANERQLFSWQQKQKDSKEELKKLKNAKESADLDKYSNSIEQLNKELHKLFEKEKEINKNIPALDRNLLDAKERVATLRGSVSPASRNPALLTIKSLKDSGTSGIYGTVAELISAEKRFEQATEASAGARLNYVITDSLDTANSLIKKLKSSKSGRCSFIPLDKIVFGRRVERVPSGALGRMSDFIQYSPQIDNAIRYIFDDTLVVADVSSAKKIGIGKYRMVTLSGELLDRSGVITGGSNRSSLLARSSLDSAEREVESIKSQRDILYSDLYSVRENMQRLRKERASIELDLRTKEAQIGSVADRKSRIERTTNEIEKISSEISDITSQADDHKTQIERLSGQEKSLISRIDEEKKELVKKREEQKESASTSQKNYQKILEKHSSFLSDIESKRQEIQLTKTQSDDLSKQISKQKESQQKSYSEIASLKSTINSSKQKLASEESHLKEISASVEKYYNKMQTLQSQLDELGKEQGQVKFKFDSQNKKLNELNIKHASVSTKLGDLKAEWEKYQDVPLLEDKQKGELESIISKCEQTLNELGMVNLKAPQLFEQKQKERIELESKTQTLQSERTAVISLIDEIESKKKRLFLGTYNTINGHFKKLFSNVFKGDGSLILDDEDNPLESGLGMRIRGEHDKRDKYLESMSGGEKTLIALLFIFSLQMKKPAPFYILDEAEAALDKQNAGKMAEFIRQMSKTAQFIAITHHDAILSAADVVLGVSQGKDGSKIVGVRLDGASSPSEIKS